MSTIIRNQGFVRTYEVDGKELKKIVFYRNGVVEAEINRGWLEDHKTKTHSVDITSMVLPVDEIKRATKVNLNRKDVYIKKTGEGWSGPEYALYINADLVGLKHLDEELYLETADKTMYHTPFAIVLDGIEYKISTKVRSETTEIGEIQNKLSKLFPRISMYELTDVAKNNEAMDLLNELAEKMK